MREDSQNDKIDARRLAELLRIDHLHPVYHGEHGLRTLKELVRSYLTVTKDLARVKTRVKAIYRSGGYGDFSHNFALLRSEIGERVYFCAHAVGELLVRYVGSHVAFLSDCDFPVVPPQVGL